MKITRLINDKPMEFELTKQELYDAHAEHVTNFMYDTLINDFNFSPEVAEDLADEAYARYCDGDGLTEYECIEEIAFAYEEEMD